MAKEFSRSQRVAQELKKNTALILQREIKDPRLIFTTITDVDLSRDLSYAKVYLTFLNDDEISIKNGLAALNEQKGYIRSLIGKAMKLRIIPEIKFIYDFSLKNAMKMDKLVSEAVDRDQKLRNEENN